MICSCTMSAFKKNIKEKRMNSLTRATPNSHLMAGFNIPDAMSNDQHIETAVTLPSVRILIDQVPENQELARANAQLQVALQQIETLSKALQDIKDIRKAEQQQSIQTNFEYMQLKDCVHSLTSRIQLLEKNYTEDQENAKMIQLSLRETEKTIEQKQAELNRLKDELFEQNQTMVQLQKTLDQADASVKFNFERSTYLEVLCNQLKNRISGLEDQLAASNQAYQTLSVLMDQINQERALAKAAFDQTNQKLTRLAEQNYTIKQLQDAVLSSHKKSEDLQKENQRLNAKLESINRILSN